MPGKFCRLVCLAGACLAFAYACLPQCATALDTPNTLFGIDAMVLRAGGLFRDPGSFATVNGNDGFNTFQFGGFSINNPITTGYGKYDAFRFQKNLTGDCCIAYNARLHSDTPETIDDPVNNPGASRIVGESITADYFPIIDQMAFGQRLDPDQYQIQVKLKPLLQKTTADSLGTNPYPTNPTYPNITAGLENTANFFTVTTDPLGGYVWDAEAGSYKRGDDSVTYDIGSDANPINTWYASAPHDADGFATYTVPLTSPSFMQKGFYYGYGSGVVRDTLVNTNGGRVQNEDGTFSDVTVGFGPNYQQFGGGPSDPSNPGSKLDVPNGVTGLAFGAGSATVGLSLEIKSIALTRIAPTNLVARIDANSGLTFRFGSGFTYGATQPPITVNGNQYLPVATDQISRFDQNGMTNLIFDERTPDNANEVNRFVLRDAPTPSTIDATNAVVNVRAKLLQPLTDPGIAQSLTLAVKGRKGNDDAPGKGADEWNYNLDLSQFNTSTMTTISIPMSAFTRNMNSSTLGAAPLGFANAGDGLLTNFGLYEFGALIPPGGGLLKLEMEYMELRTPALGLPGDFNGNHVVDAADYSVWRDHLGAAEGTLLNGNGNGGTIDPTDYALWKQNFGMANGAGGVAGATVPEPCATTLIVLGLLTVAAERRQRRFIPCAQLFSAASKRR